MKILNSAAAAMIALAAVAATAPVARAASAKDCKGETDPIKQLACFIKGNPAWAQEIGVRLVQFAEQKDPKTKTWKYLSPDAMGDSRMRAGVEAVIKAWPGNEIKKDRAYDVAVLYYVLGPVAGRRPAVFGTLAGTPLAKTLKYRKEWQARMAAGVAEKYNSASRVSKVDEIDAFLNFAAAKANTVFQQPLKKQDVKKNVARAASAVPVPGGPTSAGGPGSAGASAPPVAAPPPSSAPRPDPLKFSTEYWSFDRLYLSPASMVGKVYAHDDKGYRALSMTINTQRLPNGDLQNVIVVTDITNPSAPWSSQPIPLTSAFPMTFQVHSGGRQYLLNVNFRDGEHKIALCRTHDLTHCDGDGRLVGGSVERIMRARADMAAAGGLVQIGGKWFYTLGQGGVHGSVLFYRKDDIDNRDKRPALYLRPVSMLDVAHVDADGLTAPMTGKPDMGTIDGKHFHGEYNFDTQTWEIKDGEGDKPVDATKTSTTTATNDKTGTKPGTGAPAGDTPLDKAVKLAHDKEGWDVWNGEGAKAGKDGNAGFDPETAKKARIVSRVDEDGNRRFAVFFDPSLKIEGNAVRYNLSVTDDNGNARRLVNVRGVKQFVVVEYNDRASYFRIPKAFRDLSKMMPDFGIVYGKAASDIGDVDIAIDMLTHYFGVKEGDPRLRAVREGVAKHKPASGGYTINIGAKAKIIVMTSGAGSGQLWPTDTFGKKKKEADEPNTADLHGPGTMMVLSRGPNAKFPASYLVNNTEKQAKVRGGNADGYALYKGKKTSHRQDGTAVTPTVYSLMVAFNKPDGNPVRSAAFDVFCDGQSEEDCDTRLPFPQGVKFKGLRGKKLPPAAIVKILNGSDKDHGIIVVNASGADASASKKDLCKGVIAWWGIPENAADHACHTKNQLVPDP